MLKPSAQVVKLSYAMSENVCRLLGFLSEELSLMFLTSCLLFLVSMSSLKKKANDGKIRSLAPPSETVTSRTVSTDWLYSETLKSAPIRSAFFNANYGRYITQNTKEKEVSKSLYLSGAMIHPVRLSFFSLWQSSFSQVSKWF